MIFPKPELKYKDAQALNRKSRRSLEKLNGFKIPGTNKPYIKPTEE